MSSAKAAGPGTAPGVPRGAEPARFDFDRDLVARLPRLRPLALALTHDGADADDLVQDTARNALAARDGFTPGTDMAAWLCRILRNRFVSTRRRAREVTGRDDDLAAAAPHVRGAQEDTLVLGELRRALARLPKEQRAALVAVAVRGMSYHAVAAATGCAAGTAKSRVCRARNRLHGLLLGPEAAPRRAGAFVPSAVGAARLPARGVALFDGGGAA